MTLSTQFRALAKIAGFFAISFGAVGAVAGAITGLVPSALVTFATAYGALGGISGALTALLVARSESGRRIEDVSTLRMTAWGVLGGAAPVLLFGVLGLSFGASAAGLLPLVGLALVGGALGGTISASASAAAKRADLGRAGAHPELPG